MSAQQELTLYYFPRACSLAPHIALEESGYAYARKLVDLRTKENSGPEYLALNPMGAIPALQIDDRLLTEAHAILTFIGDTAPNGALLPAVGDPERYRAHQIMNFLSSSYHTYIRSIFRPSAYAPMDDEAAQKAVRQQGHKNLAKAVETLESRLVGREWAVGDTFSVVDAYLFIMYLWSDDDRIDDLPDRPSWAAIAERVWARPTVKSVVAIEQQDRDFKIPFGASQ